MYCIATHLSMWGEEMIQPTKIQIFNYIGIYYYWLWLNGSETHEALCLFFREVASAALKSEMIKSTKI